MAFSFSLLNPQQREAVKTIHGPVLILAGAGTGKTRVITMRIANMVDSGIDPASILAVTFTNKAASEMRERVGDLISKSASKALTIGTFHSFCVRLLRAHAEVLGYKSNFVIYSQGEQTSLVKRILGRLLAKDENYDPSKALAQISKAKNEGLDLGDPQRNLDAAVFAIYQSELLGLNAMDFDDLLIKAVELLEDNPEVLRAVQQKYRFAMVDEFQDTNSLQMRLMRALVPAPYNICVVGDDDQSIYGWRGADITNINEFESFFPNPTIIKLEENYRSTTPILHTANSLIRHNVGRRVKTLWSQNKGSDPVRLTLADDDKEEATLIAEEICETQTKGHKWEDFAVLFRTNDQSRVLEGEFRKKKIPYRVVGARSFFDRREVKDLVAYFSALNNPDDDISVLRIVNVPTRGIGPSTAELARDHSIKKGFSVFQAFKDPDFHELISDRMVTAITEFVTLIERYQSLMAAPLAPLRALADQFLEDIKYSEHLKKGIKDPEDVIPLEQGVKHLLNSLTYFEERGKAGGLQTFLDEVCLNDDREDKDDIEKKAGVCLITLHASKGLEFPVVYLPGLEEGIIPHKRSIDENRKDEERRLFYVGITRARQKLTLSHCRYRNKWGSKQTCMPSSFIKELDTKYIEHFDYASFMKEDLNTEESLDYMAQMRKELMGE